MLIANALSNATTFGIRVRKTNQHMIEFERAKGEISYHLSCPTNNAFACQTFAKPIIQFGLAHLWKAHKDTDTPCCLPFVADEPRPATFVRHALQITLHNIAKIVDCMAT